MNQSSREQRIMEIPSGYDPIIAPLVWMLEDMRQRTKVAMSGVSEQTLDWTQPEGGNAIGTLLYHIMAIEMSYLYEDRYNAQNQNCLQKV